MDRKGLGSITLKKQPPREISIQETEAQLFEEKIRRFVIAKPDIATKLLQKWLMDDSDGNDMSKDEYALLNEIKDGKY